MGLVELAAPLEVIAVRVSGVNCDSLGVSEYLQLHSSRPVVLASAVQIEPPGHMHDTFEGIDIIEARENS